MLPEAKRVFHHIQREKNLTLELLLILRTDPIINYRIAKKYV